MASMDNLATLSVSLLLTDREGVQTRFWPIYHLYVAWSVRDGQVRAFGPFNMN